MCGNRQGRKRLAPEKALDIVCYGVGLDMPDATFRARQKDGSPVRWPRLDHQHRARRGARRRIGHHGNVPSSQGHGEKTQATCAADLERARQLRSIALVTREQAT